MVCRHSHSCSIEFTGRSFCKTLPSPPDPVVVAITWDWASSNIGTAIRKPTGFPLTSGLVQTKKIWLIKRERFAGGFGEGATAIAP